LFCNANRGSDNIFGVFVAHVQVFLGAKQFFVTKVDRKQRDSPVVVNAGNILLPERINGEGVPETMQANVVTGVTGHFVTLKPCLFRNFVKQRLCPVGGFCLTPIGLK
jgi:hypothetical protein